MIKLPMADKIMRDSLDQILVAVREQQRLHNTSPYYCAMWILYACAREDARDLAQDSEDAFLDHTVNDELENMLETMQDDPDFHDLEVQMELGEKLDPGYYEPILEQDVWLAYNPNEET